MENAGFGSAAAFAAAPKLRMAEAFRPQRLETGARMNVPDTIRSHFRDVFGLAKRRPISDLRTAIRLPSTSTHEAFWRKGAGRARRRQIKNFVDFGLLIGYSLDMRTSLFLLSARLHGSLSWRLSLR